ncbi:hypothetical protein MYXO_01886 [Myxococcaceae bacterium]|nr:hypothetical protein MYXO_01886 [Myxococcaceae bacterium]
MLHQAACAAGYPEKMALMAVMILCLMVYAALEHRRLGSHRVPLALLGERHVAVYSNSG